MLSCAPYFNISTMSRILNSTTLFFWTNHESKMLSGLWARSIVFKTAWGKKQKNKNKNQGAWPNCIFRREPLGAANELQKAGRMPTGLLLKLHSYLKGFLDASKCSSGPFARKAVSLPVKVLASFSPEVGVLSSPE